MPHSSSNAASTCSVSLSKGQVTAAVSSAGYSALPSQERGVSASLPRKKNIMNNNA